MKVTTSNLPARLLASLLALPFAGVLLAALPVDVEAQTQAGWRKEVADKAAAAQTAGQKGNFSEAIRLLKEAKAKVPLSPAEEQGINELMIWAAASAKDNRLVIQTVDERIATGRVSGSDLVKKLRLKATMHYALREFREAKAALDRVAQQGSMSNDDLILLGNTQVILKDFRGATTTLEKALAGAGSKSAETRSKLLLALHESYKQTGNQAKALQTLHRLIVIAPSEKSFKWIASAYTEQSDRDPVVMISVYRLGATRGLLSGDQYMKYAEVALDLSSPGEAVAMLEKGMAKGLIKKDDRNTRLLADAKAQVERLKATLAQREKEAKATLIGEPEAKLATSYFTLRDYGKAIEAARRGVQKGKLKRADDLNMLLGIALVETKKGAEAKKAFSAAGAASEKVRSVADLWTSVAT